MRTDADLVALFERALCDAPPAEPMATSEARALRVVYDAGRADATSPPTGGIVPPYILERIDGHEHDTP